MSGPERHRVAIVGAGVGGLGLAMGLLEDGVGDFVVLERSDGVGGTWRHNTYPGLTCDIPSRYYSYTFAPNPNWSHVYSPGREIWAYLDRVAEEFGLRDRLYSATRPTYPDSCHRRRHRRVLCTRIAAALAAHARIDQDRRHGWARCG